MPVVDAAAYSILKAPIDNLTQVLGAVLGERSITVNAVAPGVIDTDMAAAFARDPQAAEFVKSKQALKRIGQPEDIADVVGVPRRPRVALGDRSGHRGLRRHVADVLAFTTT